jgi:Uma2 family endonuclease
MTSIAKRQADHMVLYDVSWNAYTKFIDALGERRLRHTYQEGTLEMMSPSEKHEWIKSFLGRIIEMASLECGLRIRSVGSATRKSKKLAQALEPDESYYIGPRAAQGRRKADTKKPLCPDLVVEVDLRRTVLDRLGSYAKLGVREVWRYRKGEIEFLVLNATCSYGPVEHSVSFPAISCKDIGRYLARLEDHDDENAIILEFVAWLRKKLKKS